MNFKRKLKRCISSGLIASILFTTSSVFATEPDLLHSSQKVQTITKGARYIQDERLTSKGWQDLHILKVDLDDPNIKIGPIESDNIGEKDTVLGLANATDAVAGVNADFFDMGSSNAPSFGVVVDDGELKHGYNNKVVGLGASNNMGTAVIDNSNKLFLNYFDVDLKVVDKQTGQKVTTISSANKPTGNLATPVYLDRSYGPTTIPLEKPNKKLYKIVVENDVVIDKIKYEKAANIPENGYVLVMDEAGAAKRWDDFSEGQSLEFKSEIKLDDHFKKSVSEIKSGVGGGGLIMKDGQLYKGASHKVSPASRQPRTVIGSSEDGKTLFLATIDGRNGSIGATHNELVSILKSYGVHNAMHLDGGGSTTFVSRDEGQEEVKVQNNPSGGSQRRVSNGIGVFTKGEKGDAARLIMSSKFDRTIVNSPLSFDIKAVDSNDNPVSITKDQVSWTTEGLTGNWKGNTFYPTSSGKGLVIAAIGEAQVAKEVTVTDEPVGLDIAPAQINLKQGQSKNLKINGIDKDGHQVPLAMDMVNWHITSSIVSVTGNQITGNKNGQALIKFSLKSNPSTVKTISAVVGEKTKGVESFEGQNPAKWGGSNSPDVTGRAESCKELKYHGNASVKFIYNLAKTNNKQVAYMDLIKPIVIEDKVQSIGMWVYGNGQKDMLKVELSNSQGNKHALRVGEVDFKGWKYMSTPIPNNIKGELKLNRLYTITTNNKAARTSSLYFDHISVNYGSRDKDVSSLRGHENFDKSHVDLDTNKHGESYDFSVMGSTNMNHYPLSNDVKQKVANSLKENTDFTVFAGDTDDGIQSLIDNKTKWPNKLETYKHSNTQVIHIGTDSGGIVSTGPSQWTGFKKLIDESTSDHIILTLNKDPFSKAGFKDQREGELFHEVLKDYQEKGKNIIVMIADGVDTDVYIKDGIRYMYINGLNTTDDNILNANKVRFRVSGDSIKYMIESVL